MLNALAMLFKRHRVVNQRDLNNQIKYNLLASGSKADSFYSRLIGYIPTDAVGAYLAGVGFLGGTVANIPGKEANPAPTSNPELGWQWGLFWVILILTPVLAAIGTYRKAATWQRRVQLFQVVSAPIAFTAWAFAIGGPFASWSHIWSPPHGAIVMLLASLGIVVVDKLFDRLA